MSFRGKGVLGKTREKMWGERYTLFLLTKKGEQIVGGGKEVSPRRGGKDQSEKGGK